MTNVSHFWSSSLHGSEKQRKMVQVPGSCHPQNRWRSSPLASAKPCLGMLGSSSEWTTRWKICAFSSLILKLFQIKKIFLKKRAKSEGGGGHTFFLSLPFLPAPTLNLSDAFCQVTMYKVLTTGSFISDFPTSENNEANRLSLFILSPACGLLLQQKRKKDSAMNMQLTK